MNSMKLTSLVGVILMATTLAMGCGPGEKTRELKDLEMILGDPEAKNVKEAPGASKPYREARQFRRLALESWEDGKDDLSREYAILGTLRYRTAEAMKGQVEAKERFDVANAKIEQTNPQILALTQERNKLQQMVAGIERKVGLAKHQNGALPTDTAKAKEIGMRLRDVETAEKAANSVDASKYAAQKYSKAVNLKNSVRSMLSTGQATDKMLADAGEAQRLYLEAKSESQAEYDNEAAKANPSQRRASLNSDASAIFGGSNVISERNGSRIVMGGLFAVGSSYPSGSTKVMMDEVVKLSKKYDEFTIFIEGYTGRSGSATENLGLSQLRANAVRDALTGAGVKSSRIDTRGFGQDRLRYDGVDDRNERVEVVMSRSN